MKKEMLEERVPSWKPKIFKDCYSAEFLQKWNSLLYRCAQPEKYFRTSEEFSDFSLRSAAAVQINLEFSQETQFKLMGEIDISNCSKELLEYFNHVFL